jgi:transcriptional regulator with XRE-family HTH domain
MPRTNKSASYLDAVIGRNIRTHRTASGLTQDALAKRLRVTYQQIQKYEKGINRVGSGRLYLIATLLKVPVTAFFDGAEEIVSSGTPAGSRDNDRLSLRLLAAFSAIRSKQIRRHVLHIVESIVKAPEE